jgi:tetratricopeptide (TPR) repeat protein
MTARCFADRAVIQEALKRPAEALKDLDTALRLAPADTASRARRAALRASSRDRDGALQDLAILDAALAPDAELRRSMAATYADLDLPIPAQRQWASWMAAHPHGSHMDDALHHRCRMRARLGIDLDDALEDCRRAIAIDPSDPTYQDSLGWLQLRRGEAREAIAAFDRSLALHPEGAWSLYGRGLARLTTNDPTRGVADLAAARRIDANIDQAVNAAGLPVAPASAD